MRWDPVQYARFADERARPFLDLLGRVGATAPRRVVDLGCGTGALTAAVGPPMARCAGLEGIDSSAEMIEQAGRAAGPSLTFDSATSTTWSPPDDTDVVISNAALQWVPRHVELLRSWAALGRRGLAGIPGARQLRVARRTRCCADSPTRPAGRRGSATRCATTTRSARQANTPSCCSTPDWRSTSGRRPTCTACPAMIRSFPGCAVPACGPCWHGSTRRMPRSSNGSSRGCCAPPIPRRDTEPCLRSGARSRSGTGSTHPHKRR